MAKPIKETPVLKGQDAKKFINDIKNVKGKLVDSKTLSRIKANFERINSLGTK
jgi:hypothetical protein